MKYKHQLNIALSMAVIAALVVGPYVLAADAGSAAGSVEQGTTATGTDKGAGKNGVHEGRNPGIGEGRRQSGQGGVNGQDVGTPGNQRLTRNAAEGGPLPGAATGSAGITTDANGNPVDVNSRRKGQEGAGTPGANFCTQLSSRAQQFEANISGESTKLEGQVGSGLQQTKGDRQSSDAKLAQDRAKWAADRQARYTTLNAKATTDAQKQAVKAFQTALEAAVTARESAVDAARGTYRAAVDALLVQHKSDVSVVLAAYRSDVQAALATAKNDCTAGKDPATVKSAFQTAMQAARDARKSKADQAGSLNTQIQALAKTRNDAVGAALQTYQSALQTAVTPLRAAFSATDTTTTTSPTTAPAPVTAN